MKKAKQVWEWLKEKNRPKGFSLKGFLVAVLTIIIFGGGYLASPYKLGASLTTDSVKCRVFIWEKKADPFQIEIFQGDYVTFQFVKEDIPEENWEFFKDLRIIKKVGCASGSYLECQMGICRCDGQQIITQTNEEISNHTFTFSGEIPPTKVFLIGDSDTSYDGRYWGLTSLGGLQGKVRRCLYTKE